MLCYKDMTFCEYYRDCAKRMECHRPLTPQVFRDAREWWGKDGAPISVFIAKPDCHVKDANNAKA